MNVFNVAKIEKQAKDLGEYVIGVDTCSSEVSSVCLAYKNKNNEYTILLAKTEKNRDEFNEMINNLCKYFNVKQIYGKT